MLSIFAYSFAVMYSPGPVNLLGLTAGLHGQARASIGFFLGVGLAMLVWLLGFGFLGARLIEGRVLVVVSALGCGYIAWLAARLARSTVRVDVDATTGRLRFRSGFVMQLVNPKTIVATLPLTTIQFPAAGLHGASIVTCSLVLAAFAAGAPGSYALFGELLGRRVGNPRWFRVFNLFMAALLLYVAASIFWQFVVRPLLGDPPA